MIVSPRAKPTRREAVRRTAPAAPRTPLRQTRRAARKRILLFILAAVVLIFALAEVVLWQSFLRVSTVEADGPDAESLKAFVAQELTGTRFLIVPKNSIFFIPQAQLRTEILAKFPQAEAVSIQPRDLTTLAVHTTPRAAVLWWCGESPDQVLTTCYETDAGGLVFKEVPLEDRYASTSTLTLYAPLVGGMASGTPAGATISSAASLPGLLQFIKAMRSLGANVVSVAIRGDEADLYTQAGTRITYVLGREEQAAQLAASGFSNLNLNDGSLLYVDLRFDSKVFFKKK